MENTRADPERLRRLHLGHDGILPPAARALALAADGVALSEGRRRCRARFLEGLCRDAQRGLARLRSAGGDEAQLQRLYGLMLFYRSQAMA